MQDSEDKGIAVRLIMSDHRAYTALVTVAPLVMTTVTPGSADK